MPTTLLYWHPKFFHLPASQQRIYTFLLPYLHQLTKYYNCIFAVHLTALDLTQQHTKIARKKEILSHSVSVLQSRKKIIKYQIKSKEQKTYFDKNFDIQYLSTQFQTSFDSIVTCNLTSFFFFVPFLPTSYFYLTYFQISEL